MDEAFSRNLGLVSETEQNKLSQARVAICGLGGMGGVCAEVLLRLGVGKFVLADHDVFETSNFNRQIHSDSSTVGQHKVDAIAQAMKKVNPKLDVRVERKGVTSKTIQRILEDVDIVVNGMDQMQASLLLERTARGKRIPIVDAWLTPFASVFVMKPESPHWEEYLDMPTRHVPVEELDENLCQQALKKEIDYTLSFGDPLRYVDEQLVDDVLHGRRPRPSLAPVVWMSGVMMANEVFKLVLGYETVDHIGVMYDQYQHRMLSNSGKMKV